MLIPGGSCRCCRHLRRRQQRQPDDDTAALATALAEGMDLAVVKLDQMAHERETDAQAALRPVEISAGPPRGE